MNTPIEHPAFNSLEDTTANAAANNTQNNRFFTTSANPAPTRTTYFSPARCVEFIVEFIMLEIGIMSLPLQPETIVACVIATAALFAAVLFAAAFAAAFAAVRASIYDAPVSATP